MTFTNLNQVKGQRVYRHTKGKTIVLPAGIYIRNDSGVSGSMKPDP
jgi:hypothetical protein